MVQGMAFLSKKGFNPQNNANRKQVWEAQQKSKHEKERLRKRQEQLKREQEDEELELATRGEIGGNQAQLRFMYDAPPGMEKKDNANYNGNDNLTHHESKLHDKSDASDLTRVKPGDDAAAVAFRQMLAASVSNDNNEDEGDMARNAKEEMNSRGQANNKAFKFTPSLQGSMVEADSRYNNLGDHQNDNSNKNIKAITDSRSALEKEVGRKNRSSQNNLSYEQQIERFPQLKNAPMVVKSGSTTGNDGGEGGSSAPMMVHFKPLGSQILHVRCLACGVWGHARGDRECKKSGWNPFALPSSSSQNPNNKSSASSILPSKIDDANGRDEPSRRSQHNESSDHRRRHQRHRERYDSDSSDSDVRRRSRKQRRRNEFDDDADNRKTSRKRDRHRRKSHRHRYNEPNRSDDISHSDPSSENSSKLKQRNDDRYSSSEDYDRHDRDYRDDRRKKSHYSDRKSSKTGSRSNRYQSSSHKKKKKKRRHHSP